MNAMRSTRACGIIGMTIFCCAGFSAPANSMSAISGKFAAENTTIAMAKNKQISRDGEPKTRGFMSNDVFGMKDEEYFNTPFKYVDTVGDRLVDEGFDGMIIGGPGYIPIGKVDRFPIIALRVAESMESSRHLFKEYALITAMDLLSNEFYASNFVERKFVKQVRDLEKDPPPPGRVTDGGAVNLFTCLGLPNRIGEYLITTILLNNSSNRIRVRVGPSDLENDRAKFDEALLKTRPKVGRKGRRVTSEKLIGHVRDAKSPAVPETPGISLIAESQWMEKGNPGPVTLYGSYHIANPLSSPLALKLPPGEAEKITLPVSLLATGTRVSAALVLELDLPIPLEVRNSTENFLKGFFTVKLSQSDGLEGSQTYYFRAFSGSQASGATEVTLPK